MKIVIDISDQKYKWIVDNPQIYTDDLCETIRNGTPLPEHHGRLIDYGCVVDAIDDWINAGEYGYTNATDYLKTRIKDAPTIIEGSDSE